MAFPANKPHSLTLSSITHSFILIHSLVHICSCTYSLTPSSTRSFSFTHSVTHSFTQLFPHSFTLSLMHSFIFTPFIHSFTFTLIHSLTHSFNRYLKCRLCPALLWVLGHDSARESAPESFGALGNQHQSRPRLGPGPAEADVGAQAEPRLPFHAAVTATSVPDATTGLGLQGVQRYTTIQFCRSERSFLE